MIFVGFSLSFVGFVGFVGFGVVPDPPGLGLDKDLGTWKPTKPTKLNEKPTKIKPRPTKIINLARVYIIDRQQN